VGCTAVRCGDLQYHTLVIHGALHWDSIHATQSRQLSGCVNVEQGRLGCGLEELPVCPASQRLQLQSLSPAPRNRMSVLDDLAAGSRLAGCQGRGSRSKIAPGSPHDHVGFSRCKSYRSYLERVTGHRGFQSW
jgi:hypothetical protein